CPGGVDDYAFDPAGMQFAILSMPAAVSSEFVDVERLAAPDGCSTCVLRPAATDSMALRRRLTGLNAAAEGERDVWIAETLGQEAAGLSERLIMCLRRNLPHGRSLNNGARSLVVRRAEQFFRCHVGEPVSIAQLSTIAGVSERSLRNAFYHVCTTSPKRYLKL